MDSQEKIKNLEEQIEEMQAKLDQLEAEGKQSGDSQGAPTKYKGNSWTQMALNDERKQKLNSGKGMNSVNSQKIITIIAAIILILSLIVPRLLK